MKSAAQFPSAQNFAFEKLRIAHKKLERLVVLSPSQSEIVFAALLAHGHLLLEGPPGMGKTTLAKALAEMWDVKVNRIQMTSDLLPADVVGYLRYHPGLHEFEMRFGPIFANIVLADELNRGNSRTQSALLEAMAEKQVSIDGKSHPLPDPFFVIATQNPNDSAGVFELSESQSDRFSASLWLESLSEKDEMEVFQRHLSSESKTSSDISDTIKLSGDDLRTLQSQCRQIQIEPTLVAFVQQILVNLRASDHLSVPPSIRCGVQFLSTVKALAFVRNRDFVSPKDIIDAAPYVLGHRLHFKNHSKRSLKDKWAWAFEFVRGLPPPV